MRIIIECKESTVGNRVNNFGGELYDFVIETSACDYFKCLADKVAMDAVEQLKEGVHND